MGDLLRCLRICLLCHFFCHAINHLRHAAKGVFQSLESHLHNIGSHAFDVAEPPRQKTLIRLGFFKRGLNFLQLGFYILLFGRLEAPGVVSTEWYMVSKSGVILML